LENVEKKKTKRLGKGTSERRRGDEAGTLLKVHRTKRSAARKEVEKTGPQGLRGARKKDKRIRQK